MLHAKYNVTYAFGLLKFVHDDDDGNSAVLNLNLRNRKNILHHWKCVQYAYVEKFQRSLEIHLFLSLSLSLAISSVSLITVWSIIDDDPFSAFHLKHFRGSIIVVVSSVNRKKNESNNHKKRKKNVSILKVRKSCYYYYYHCYNIVFKWMNEWMKGFHIFIWDT